ncbi:alpha/beta fold hydrolase [Dactylosporangium cerinum]|uniref:Alpha/beta fold hydrolase n=1 Tax=Dactylosporangium cerinum TaxID=1434730 RepID=A0ABV9W234_9ACTN
MTLPTRAVENEFADLLAPSEHPSEHPPAVARRWVNVTTGGHVSAVVWGHGSPEVVLLHDEGADARTFDALLSRVDRPVAALDLPGHGRSNGETPAPPAARLARPVIEAIRSFAPRHRLLVAQGLGARVALHAAHRDPAVVGRLLLIDSLPGPLPEDEPLWERLPALRHPPLLVRSLTGKLTDAEVQRFTQAVAHGSVTVTADTGPAALADIIDIALH